MPKFKGTVTEVPRLHSCPVCNSQPVMRKDSTKRFQIWCKCGCKTGWTTKAQSVVDWYNLILAIEEKEKDTALAKKEG